MTVEPLSDLRVLVVDDFESQRTLTQRMLATLGVTRVHFEWDADRILRAVETFDPDLVLLDLHLDRASTLGALNQLAATGNWRRRRVAIVTGDTDPEAIDAALRAGAHAVLHKPFMLDEFTALVTDLAEQIRTERREALASPAGPIAIAASRAARLVEVVRDLAAAQRLDDVVDVVRVAARQLTGADGATFILRDGDQCHYVDEDAIAPLWKGRRFPMSACISGWSMLHRQVAAIEDIYLDDRIPHDAYRPTFVKSLVMVPIRTSDPVGAIGCYWAQTHAPDEAELRLLQALADSTAVAMQNSRLFGQLEAVHERTAELASANEQLREFVHAVAHDVRTPLATIVGFTDLLQGETDLGSPTAREAIGEIQSSARSLTAFVSDLLDFAMANGRTLDVALVPMRELVDDVTRRLALLIRTRSARVVLDDDEPVLGDRVLLTQTLQNLIGNAIAYTPQDRRPEVRVSVSSDDSGWDLTVSDNGAGVTADDRAVIFEAFRRGSAGAGTPGSGLGLALCRRVAERHGGRIDVREGPTGGAQFVVRLPVG